MIRNMSELISTDALRTMALAGAIDQAVVAAQADGSYVLRVRAGSAVRTLGAKRGGARRYSKIDTAAQHLAALGLRRAELDLGELQVDGTTLVTRGRQQRLAL